MSIDGTPDYEYDYAVITMGFMGIWFMGRFMGIWFMGRLPYLYCIGR